LLIDNRRDVLIGSIAEQYDELKREHEKVLRARITSAQPLTTSSARRSWRRSKAATARRSKPTWTWIPELLGGARVQVGDQVIHASMRDALAQMAAALAR
jgi:F-type H+-transporting ATPase subunit delta